MRTSCSFILLCLAIVTGYAQSPPAFQLTVSDNYLQVPPDGNLIQPTGVAVNSQGHVFAFNKGNRQLMEFGADGSYIRSLGAGIFKDPHGLRIDRHDRIWTTDLESHLVIRMSPEGRVELILGQNGTSGLYDDTRDMVLFFKPADVAFAPSGDIFVADGYGNHRVVHLDAAGNLINSWGTKGSEPGAFDNPHNIVYSQGKVYVADRYNHRIQVFNADGTFVDAWNNVGQPWGLDLSPDHHLYVTDGLAEQIIKMDLTGNILGTWKAGPGTQPGQLRAAHGIAVGPQEELYVTEVLNWRIQRFDQHWERGPWKRILPHGCAHVRHESAFVEVNGRFYALGGRNNRKVDIYDPATNTWSQGADTPLEMHHFQAVAYQGEIWVVGAFTGPYPKEEPIAFLHVYDPQEDRWRIGGKLPDGRHRGAAGAVAYKDKIYLLCGNEEGHYSGHNHWFDAFDPATRRWSTLPDAPHTRDHFQMAVIDDKLFVAGGRNSSQKTNHVMDQTIAEVDVFDFNKQQWTTLEAPLPTLRAGTTVVATEDQLIVMGGESHAQVSAHDDVEALNIETGNWHQLPPMLQGRHGMQAVHYEGKVYIAGGSADRGGGPELNSLDCWNLEH